MNDRGLKCRFAVSAVLMVSVLVGLGCRLAFLHLGPHDAVLASAEEGYRVEKRLLAGRGNIHDRRGHDNILALNLAVKNVCANPKHIAEGSNLVAVASQLAQTLGLPTDVVAEKLNRPECQYKRLQRFVPMDKVELLRERELAGVFFEDETIRHYPQRSFLCHVLGFVNYQGIGSAGVEQSMDKYLRGCPGLRETRVDALRREIYWEGGEYIPALEGADIALNIDQNVQYFVETALDEVMQEHNAKGAWAIVERVKTGEILAMAARPSYDPNEFNKVDQSMWLNRAVGYVYEPGSTFKAVVFSAAFNERVTSPKTIIDCENGAWFYGKRVLRDYHAYDRLTVADGIKKSSNILSAKLALMLGNQRFYDYLRAYSIGTKLNVDLPGEENGILHKPSQWSKISSTRIAIGQGVAVTALQVLQVYCAIANNGYLMKPYVISQVTGRDGSVYLKPLPEVLSRPISPETASLMRRLLARVTEDGGTGRRARVDGYSVAGKTGTAQKPVNGRYSNTAHMASFVGFLPAEDPEIGVIVVVDEPQPYHTGGRVAGPAFGKIAAQTVRYLDIPPVRQDAVDRRLVYLGRR